MWARGDILSWCETFLAVVCSLSLTCLVIMSFISSVWAIFLIFPLDDHLPSLCCAPRVVAYEKVDFLASFLLPISLRAPFDRASNRRLRDNWGRFSFFVCLLTPLRHPLRHCPITAGLTLDERLLSSVANLYLWNFDRRLYFSLSPRPPCLASNFKKMSPTKTTQQVSLFTGISMLP